MPRRSRLALALVALVVLAPGHAAAQERRDADRPQGGVVAGRVVDDRGEPVARAAVTLDDGRPVRTDAAGRFAIRVDACGAYRVSVRVPGLVGVTTVVDPCAPDRPESVELVLRPIATVLDAMQVRERVSGVVGTVVDARGRPRAGVAVRVLGTPASAVTDSLGAFRFIGIEPGPHLLSLRDEGSRATRRVAVTLGEGDVREVLLPLRELDDEDRALGSGAERIAEAEFARRREFGGIYMVRVGREELAGARDPDLTCALAMIPKVRRAFPRLTIENCNRWSPAQGCILVDGWREGVRPLNTFDTSEVEYLELFPGTPSERNIVFDDLLGLPVELGARFRCQAGSAVVVWLR